MLTTFNVVAIVVFVLSSVSTRCQCFLTLNARSSLSSRHAGVLHQRPLVAVFSTTSPLSRSNAQQESKKPKPDTNIEFVDFGGTQVASHQDLINLEKWTLPCVPTLDRLDGPLPPGAHLPAPTLDEKRTSRISLEVEWHNEGGSPSGEDDPYEGFVKSLQQCMDGGFFTFQLPKEKQRSGEAFRLISRFQRETPLTLERHWILRFWMPISSNSINSSISLSSVRKQVLLLLQASELDSFDTLLVQYDPQLQMEMHLEVLEHLTELQREGLLRSIAVEDWPSKWILQARGLFNLSAVQQSTNWLVAPALEETSDNDKTTTNRENLVSWWTGGVLGTDLWTYPETQDIKKQGPFAVKSSSTRVERRKQRDLWLPPTHLTSTWNLLRNWASLNGVGKNELNDLTLWQIFQKDVLDPLEYMSEKHEVSKISIVLRWLLQQTAGVPDGRNSNALVVPFSLDQSSSSPTKTVSFQLKELRNVFRFELDASDCRRFESFVARIAPTRTTVVVDDEEMSIDDIPVEFLESIEAFELEQIDAHDEADEQDEYPEIDFSNPALWF